ncbi:acyltransferase family protein [Bradyrhizobium betae]|uniref:acyltransferase family protein n=1 Tax=Bradyrhizobium betae TaxID=244734 RepID=UPI001FCF2875|nr:acyltransferase [Bradyrhizobium betae]MCS3730044.1 peptidoglycan/LPS O-acetylase OafA/YrhL [Bradyrhizobium betae]
MKSHLPLLDPLRFAAALGVAIFHQMFWSWAWVSIGVPGFERTVAADVLYPSAAPYTWFGWVGVEIFFVISGFVIANSASQASPGEFLLGRALRLYPAVWVCATATFLVLLLFGSGPASEFILPYIHAMLMVPKGVTGEWLDEVYWTLAAETAFYGLVFCAMLTKRITLRHLAWGLTIYSAMFNAVALLVASCTTPSDLPYLVILMFRVPCAAFLLSHGCFFALGIWLFISANRELTALEQVAVAVTCLSGAAEIYVFASFFLTSIPAIADQSALVPIMVWAAAVLLIARAAKRSRRSVGTVSPAAPAYLRTLGLITYPLYLTHNVIGTAIVRALVVSGLDATSAVWMALGMLVLMGWFICAKIEPAVRYSLMQALAHLGKLPERQPKSRRPTLARGLRLPLPVSVKANVVAS